MLTSASATPQAALAKLLAGFTPECSSPAISSEPALSPLWRSSRYIRQATHSSRIPPARTRPTICSSCDDDQREGDAQHQRRDDADHDDLLALLGRQARGERADDDRIVAGKHDVDEQDLEEGGDARSA